MRAREGKLSLELVLESGQVLPEITDSGVTYVVAPPAERFTVRATNGRSKAIYQVELSVDGVDVGILKIVHPGESRTFKGVLVKSVGDHAKWKLFQFRDTTGIDPALRQAVQSTALDSIKLGRLEFTVVQVVDSGREEVSGDVHRNLHDAPQGVKLPDGKKWFLAPSLSAANGPMVAEDTEWDATQWREVSGRSKYTLRYETASTLVLRGILQEDQVGSSALIQAFLRQEADRVVAADGNPERADTSAGGNRMAPISPRARAYMRHLQQAAASYRQRALVVDLSIEKDDEVLCDLTGEAPAWHCSKKPRIVID